MFVFRLLPLIFFWLRINDVHFGLLCGWHLNMKSIYEWFVFRFAVESCINNVTLNYRKKIMINFSYLLLYQIFSCDILLEKYTRSSLCIIQYISVYTLFCSVMGIMKVLDRRKVQNKII